MSASSLSHAGVRIGELSTRTYCITLLELLILQTQLADPPLGSCELLLGQLSANCWKWEGGEKGEGKGQERLSGETYFLERYTPLFRTLHTHRWTPKTVWVRRDEWGSETERGHLVRVDIAELSMSLDQGRARGRARGGGGGGRHDAFCGGGRSERGRCGWLMG